MKKTLILLILILAPCFAYGKDRLLINQPWDGFPGWNAETVDVDSVSQLPTKIQFIVNYWIKKSMTDFANNVKLVRGQIMDIESLFANDSIPQTEDQGIIPKYQLFYELSDSSLNIGAYGFEVTLDQYGQVIYFGWPKEDYNKREKFVKPQSVLDFAIRYCKKKNYKTDKRNYELRFDPKLNKMCWNISFIQKTFGDKNNGSQDFIMIVLDAINLNILDEFKDTLAWCSVN